MNTHEGWRGPGGELGGSTANERLGWLRRETSPELPPDTLQSSLSSADPIAASCPVQLGQNHFHLKGARRTETAQGAAPQSLTQGWQVPHYCACLPLRALYPLGLAPR